LAEQSFEYPVGKAIAQTAASALASKAQQPTSRLLILATFAGAFIAMGSIASLVSQAAMADTGLVNVASGAAFSVGLIMVMIVGAELFTGNTMQMLPAITGDLELGRLAGTWAIVWTGNLIGSGMVALLFAAAGGLGDGVGDAAIALVQSKLAKPAPGVFSSAILANILVCLAVWMSMGAQTIPAKILAIVGPVTVFVAAGLEHSVANMSILPLGWLAEGGSDVDIAGGVANLAISTAGNIIGGAILAIGVAYGHDALRKSG
jgi:formate/nitrite transporter